MAVAPLTLSRSAWPWRLVEAPGACMDARELARWDAANEQTYGLVHAASPCRDCTPVFAAEMRFEGRCHGQPGSVLNTPPELEALRRRWPAVGTVCHQWASPSGRDRAARPSSA